MTVRTVPMCSKRFVASYHAWFAAGVAAACLLALVALGSLRALRAHIVEERKGKIRATVQTVHGVLARYGSLADAGSMSQEEAQRAALETVRALRYEKNEYFWINDLQPRMVMHPTMPVLDGKDLADYADPTGKHLFQEIVRVVQAEPAGEGFVAYRWSRREGTEAVRKVSFAKLYVPWGWIVGSGIYLDDIDAALLPEARWWLASTALLALLLGVAGMRVAHTIKRVSRREEQQRQVEAIARRHQRALRMLSECNEALVRAADEPALFEGVCRALVDGAGLPFSWVGIAEHDERKTVRPAAHVGGDGECLSALDIVWSDAAPWGDPVATAIRTGKPAVARDLRSAPELPAWHIDAARHGCASLAAFPLVAEKTTLGALVVYSAEAGGFDDDMRILADIADNLAYGVAALRGRAERARITAQLVQADRLVAMGTLAAGVAHEINNPLAYVLAGLDFVERELRVLPEGAVAEMRQTLQEIRHGAERIRQAVRDLKTFSRADEDSCRPVEMQRLLGSSLNIAFNEIRHRARIVHDYGSTPMVNANESRLGQVFLNLIINAAQAIPEGVTDRNEIRLVTRTDAAGRAVVEVRDTGCGIAPEHIQRIFEPFFTTKPIGVGTGLGLSICRDAIAALGGELTVESELGKGSVFRVVLPPWRGTVEVARTAAMPQTSGRRGRILAVDDEPLVARAIRRALEPTHEVVIETTAKGALDRLVSGERFDLVICDLMMPEKSGMDLHADLNAAHPAIAERIVFLSGGAFTPKAKAFLDVVRNPVLEKPFDSKALRAFVNGLLRQRPGLLG